MSDYETIERIARQLCEEAGRDYDAKWYKRAHWRKKAGEIIAIGWGNPRPILDALLRACGWRI